MNGTSHFPGHKVDLVTVQARLVKDGVLVIEVPRNTGGYVSTCQVIHARAKQMTGMDMTGRR